MLRPHLEDGAALVHTAREAGVSERTAQRWLARYRYRNGGLVGLAAPQRSDRGGRRMPDELVAVIEGIALRRPRPSAATVHRRAVQVAERHGWRAPSYATVHAIVRTLDPAMVTLAHDKRYTNTGRSAATS